MATYLLRHIETGSLAGVFTAANPTELFSNLYPYADPLQYEFREVRYGIFIEAESSLDGNPVHAVYVPEQERTLLERHLPDEHARAAEIRDGLVFLRFAAHHAVEADHGHRTASEEVKPRAA